MSRIYEALQQSAKKSGQSDDPSSLDLGVLAENTSELVELPVAGSPGAELEEVPSFALHPSEDKRLVAASDESGLAAEKLRMLITRLRHIQRRRPFRKILITSTIRGEGKSTIAANLALALARQNQRTLLIDGDLRRPSLSLMLDIPGSPGLSEWWPNQGSIAPFLRRLEGSPLWFLPSGNVVNQPAELLQSPAVSQLLAALGQRFEWVIIDSPPVAPIADAGSWIALADVVLMVVRSGLTPQKLLQQSLSLLERSKMVGIVLNDARCVDQKYYRGYYASTRQPSEPI